jgi:glycerate dehydrogenase
MPNAVFLNAAKLDFDGRLDFSPVTRMASFTRFETSSESEILGRVQGQDIVITKELPVGRELIQAFPASVKLLIEAGTGYNNLDLAAARERGVTVCNIPAYSSAAVAQLTVALMLNLASSLHVQQRMLLGGDRTNFTQHLKVPHGEVQGKTLGLIGGGAIGRQVIQVATALGMRVLVCDPAPLPDLGSNAHAAVLEEVLAESDFLSLHCPLTPETRHLIRTETLRLMKPTACIINCARGPIIREADLVAALDQGRLAGAALDVQEVEPPSAESPLWNHPKILLTPHIGWKPLEARQRLIGILADNIRGFFEGRPVNVVS